MTMTTADSGTVFPSYMRLFRRFSFQIQFEKWFFFFFLVSYSNKQVY